MQQASQTFLTGQGGPSGIGLPANGKLSHRIQATDLPQPAAAHYADSLEFVPIVPVVLVFESMAPQPVEAVQAVLHLHLHLANSKRAAASTLRLQQHGIELPSERLTGWNQLCSIQKRLIHIAAHAIFDNIQHSGSSRPVGAVFE